MVGVGDFGTWKKLLKKYIKICGRLNKNIVI